MRFITQAPVRIVSMTTCQERIFVATEHGVFWVKRTNAKNPKFKLIPVKMEPKP